ncbi:MAG: 3-dehydroquinate synthase, partial [Bacteroidaceae bacterium]|nr:3-dehydroquinate synthase [Bacteroidaceae bacterium]
MNNVIISTNIEQTLTEAIARVPHDKLFVLTDEITHRLCLPIIKDLPCMAEAQAIVIGATDTHKTIDTLVQVWTALGNGG